MARLQRSLEYVCLLPMVRVCVNPSMPEEEALEYHLYVTISKMAVKEGGLGVLLYEKSQKNLKFIKLKEGLVIVEDEFLNYLVTKVKYSSKEYCYSGCESLYVIGDREL